VTYLVIGVVSHAGSRFESNCGPDGFAHALARALTDLAVACEVRVNTADEHDPDRLPIDGALVQASLDAEFGLEGQWAAYLAAGGGRQPRPWDGAYRALRRLRARWRLERGTQPGVASDAGARMVRRLVNIELSHRRLLRAGVESGAPWILILEDDACCADIGDCATGLAGLFETPGPAPAYINLSQSFTAQRLGIDGLLHPATGAAWRGREERKILASHRPVTNTVCAIAYRRAFAEQLLTAFELMPMTPVVPIDWKLNAALMAMHDKGALGDGDCWLVEPAPMIQRSMHQVSAL